MERGLYDQLPNGSLKYVGPAIDLGHVKPATVTNRLNPSQSEIERKRRNRFFP